MTEIFPRKPTIFHKYISGSDRTTLNGTQTVKLLQN